MANMKHYKTRFGGTASCALELVMAMAVVCMTVFSCAVNGCFVQPFLLSHRQSGFSSTKPISPARTVSAFGQSEQHTCASGLFTAQGNT